MSEARLSRGGWLVPFMTGALALAGCKQSATPASEPEVSGGAGGFVADTKPVPAVHWLEATVPKDTPIKLSMIDTLSPQTSHQGDTFRALVTEALMIKGMVVVPSGSNVLGVVSEVGPQTVRLRFDRIDTPTGASAPLKARLSQGAPGPIVRSSAPLTVVLEEPLLIKVKQ